MFEEMELGQVMEPAAFDAAVEELRVELLELQSELLEQRFPVVVEISGFDRRVNNRVINDLFRWFDARYIRAVGLDPPNEDEAARPRLWRYWRALPPHGRMTFFLDGWTMELASAHALDELDERTFEQELAHNLRFTRTLMDDGAIALRIWLHVSEKRLRKRVRKAEKEPEDAWVVPQRDQALIERYERSTACAERAISATMTERCPWHVIEADDRRFATWSVAVCIRDALRARLAQRHERGGREEPIIDEPASHILQTVDVTRALDDAAYEERLGAGQKRLHRLSRQCREAGVSSVLAFEGWDAAGKGGAILRLAQGMDAVNYEVVRIGAPTPLERQFHWLWRFWRDLPEFGEMTIWDRTWYGRVLVERVEGFAAVEEWRRAMAEIRDFEEQLVERGIVLQKFWLHIDAAEQLRRFQEREDEAYKQYKITDEDWRNRDRWNHYLAAVDEMVRETSTAGAPWQLIPATDKRLARVLVVEAVADALEAALERRA